MRVLAGRLLFLSLCNCGLETTVPPAEDDTPNEERAVFISRIVYTEQGLIVTCRLNEALVSYGEPIPVFIEFARTIVEISAFTGDEDDHEFSVFQPAESGTLLCGIRFAGAEFVSEGIEVDPLQSSGAGSD